MINIGLFSDMIVYFFGYISKTHSKAHFLMNLSYYIIRNINEVSSQTQQDQFNFISLQAEAIKIRTNITR